MALTRGLKEVDGFFKTSARLVQADVDVDTVCTIWGSGALAFYSVDIADDGEGILLDNGNYANPLLIGGDEVNILAPDLTYPGSKSANNRNYTQVLGIDGTSGFTTALSLNGKFSISFLNFINMTAESISIRLTVDDEVKWDSSYTSGTTELLFSDVNTGSGVYEVQGCETSFLLEISTTADNNVGLQYLARPMQ